MNLPLLEDRPPCSNRAQQKRIFARILLTAFLFGLAAKSVAFGNEHAPVVDTRVVGRFSLPDGFRISKVKIESSQLVLLEEFAPKPLPTPKEFADWTQAERNEWYSKWMATEQGKKFQAAEESRFQKLKKHETKVKQGFEFKFAGVLPGNYDLAGELVVEHQSRKYYAEFVAKVVVSEVEEINLDRIELKFFRILQMGDSLPEFEFKSRNDKKVNRKKLKGKNVLFVFWSPANAFSQAIKQELAQLANEKSLRVVAIGIGDADKHDEFLNPDSFATFHGFAANTEAKICRAFGVSSVPFVWLADREGRIIVDHQTFATEKFQIQKTVLKALGKNLF